MDKYYWTDEDFVKVKVAGAMPELLSVALEILARMPEPVALVSGPISTGGKGSIRENLEVFRQAIESIHQKGVTVFNQLPFEDKFSELSKQSNLAYFTPILEDFFLPLFKTGKIKSIYFMPGWESSTGAKWEYDIADKLGMKKVLMPDINGKSR